MDILKIPNNLRAILQKYRYAFIVFVIGLGLMLLPEGSNRTEAPSVPTSVETQPEIEDLESRLELILSQISGAGRVDVLLTEQKGSQTIYHSDEESGQDADAKTMRSSVVITKDSDHAESALVSRIDPPLYQGAVIVCQGADNSSVKLAIVEAVRCATGLGADQITVVKMK